MVTNNKKALRQLSEGFSLTAENFFAKVCNEIENQTYKLQKEKINKKFKRRLIKMATREENIKKINDALEKLSDEELEKVAVGFYARSNVDDVKPDVNIDNQGRILHVRDEQSRILHVR